MKKIIIIVISAFIFILIGIEINNQSSKYKSNKVVQAFKTKAVNLKTVKYNSGFEDLMPLKAILKDKRIVAMGEATHGTKEFFQMKHRMFQFLVEEMGYNVFAMEASQADCMAVNDYILNGNGDPSKLIKNLGFWTWDTKEVLDMVEWMKEYNKTHEKKIKFYGFDMQSSHTAAQNIINYLNKVDPSYEASVHEVLSKFNDKILDYGVKKQLPIDGIKQIKNIFEKNKDEYIKKSSKEQYELYMQNLNVICEFYDMFGTGGSDFQKETKRDKYMAENVKWILDHEGEDSKIMLWAHNLHVSKGIDKFGSSNSDYPEGNVKRMGSNLYDMYGSKMYVIGFEFNKGDLIANYTNKENGQTVNGKCTLKAAKENSAAYIFSKVNPIFFIDFNTCKKNKYAKNILSKPQYCHDIGAVFPGENKSFESEILDLRYDGLIFADTTSSVEPN
ncbi:erythromycin esterase family protein [Clostridium coskatii]|uniref:Erythromycin esterase n=1 Tax=Clostridium coskatii TaxID=1705578 RepID=A0A170NNG3_9CLOT|nr:erythromycin esterase family protein [Clostridium coskatii]OAA93293.1 Erythromycin esterase [Clostridium coskatii]OBR95324.1 erythromycin esterase [Clostridium coskatii]